MLVVMVVLLASGSDGERLRAVKVFSLSMNIGVELTSLHENPRR